jgi:TatA/E family protein of Tat protein translocase
MFGMGMPEVLLILAIALIVLGPKKLPEIARALGRGIAEFRKATQDLKENLDVDNDLKAARDAFQEIKGDIEGTVKTPAKRETPHEKREHEESSQKQDAKGQEEVEDDVEKAPTVAEEEASEDHVREETPSSKKGPSQHG